MCERSCTSASRAYQALRSALADPRAAGERLAAKGKPIVWTLGDDVPEEIILACGMTPVRLFGWYGPRPNAEKYLEASFGALWRGYFETVAGGHLGETPQTLVLSNSSDLIQKLYYYFLQLGRLEPERAMPRLYYVDYSLMVKDFSAQERNVRESRDFLRAMEELSGRQADGQALEDAIALCNRHRQALRALEPLRRAGRLLGSEALTAAAGSLLLEKQEAAALLEQLAADAKTWPETALMPVLYTGSAQETPEVYRLMEQAGLNVVAEDKVPGWRYCDRDVDGAADAVTAVTLRYHLRFPSSERGFVAERADCIPALLDRCGARGLVVFMNRNDESYIWDLPAQRKVLSGRGIPVLTVEDQDWPLKQPELLTEQFSAFARQGGADNG